MALDDVVIGIDLGTTNSEVAVYRQGRAEVITDDQGRKIVPSFVSVAEDGSILVGEEARNQYVLFPERTVKSVKRNMGESQRLSMAGQTYLPQEISAIILKHLKQVAEKYLGQSVQKAVITVPAYFSDAQRQATREAGEIAGLEVLRMINEPTAAALVYEAGHQEGKKILVYDLGGGTFDVSVVRIEEGVVEVISSHGDNHLGGDDFDEKIVTTIVTHIQEQHQVDVTTSTAAMARLRRAAETAKRVLSDHPFAQIEEEYLLEKDGKPVHVSLELSRTQYEEMISPFIDKTLDAVHITLKGAGLTASDVESVLLVGGTTRTPLVVTRLQKVFGVRPRGEVDPDLCVVMGASIQAASIVGQEVSAVLVDVTPYTFGVSAYGEVHGVPSPDMFVPVILKNSAIPTNKSELFYTMYANQRDVEVRVYQGENADALKNRLIGEFLVTGLSNAPSGSPVVMRMDLDADGLLHVAAIEKQTGLAKRITISNALQHLDEGAMVDAQARLGDLFGTSHEAGVMEAQEILEDEEGQEGQEGQEGHAKDGQNQEAANRQEVVRARALVEKAEKMLNQASPEDQEEIIDLLDDIRQALAQNDLSTMQTSSEALSEILFYLET